MSQVDVSGRNSCSTHMGPDGDAIAAEVHELQARIKELEALKRSRADEASRIIGSQRTTIDRLKAENQRLTTDLSGTGVDAAAVAAIVAGNGGSSTVLYKSVTLTPQQNARVDKLTELADTYSRKIDVEQRQLDSLERELEVAQAQLLAARKDVGGHSGVQQINMAPAKAIKSLETRLEAAQRRYNEHIAANKDLKQQIDAATRTQAKLEQVRAQLEREVAAAAGELVSVHEATRVATEAKQEAQAQAAALRVAEDAEAAAFEVEVKELAACSAADEKLLQAQATRLTRVVEAAEAVEAGAGGGGGQEAMTAGAPKAGGGEPLDLDSLEQGVGVEAAINQLIRAAGLSSLPEALQHYASLEQRSFDLFTACNEASERIAAMGREAKELEAEVRQMEADGVAGRQNDAIRQVLARRDTNVRRLEGLMERKAAIERRVAMLKAGISSCLRKLGAASAAQEWEAAAPAPPPHPTAGGIDSASATAASRAACDHVNRGLAVLEQRAAAIVSVQGTMVGRAPPASGPLSAAARSSGSFSRPASAAPPAAAQAAGSASSAAPPHLRPASGASTESQPQSLSQPQRQSYRESTASYGMADSRRPSSAQTGVSVLDAVAAAAGIMDRNYEVIVSDEEGEARATEDGHPAPAIRGADERSPVPGSSNDDITGAGGNDEEEDDEDEDEMPLTRAQIQARSAASVVHAMSGNGRAPFQLP